VTWASNVCTIGTQSGGTGVGRSLTVSTAGNANLVLSAGTGMIDTTASQIKMIAGTTGSGSAALGANCPASTATAPYTWLKVTASDGSQVYVPAWK
jgi:hypothetical protein